MDCIYIAIIVVFFLATWGLVRLCEVLEQDRSGGKS
jgi:hypothetical protein